MRHGSIALVAAIALTFASAPSAAQSPEQASSPRAPVASDARFTQALARADALEGTDRVGELIETLKPWSELGDPGVDFRLASAHLRLATDGRKPADVDQAAINRAVGFAERAASKGDGGAMNLLYMIHGNGFGRPIDMTLAMKWLERSVAAGDPGARVNLASMLYEGRAWLPRDRPLACRMFVDVAQIDGAGAPAMYYLGWANRSGECGFNKDPVKGADLIRRAAEGGVLDAARDYGRLLEAGTDVKADSAAALVWYDRAADGGDAFSQWRIGRAYAQGEGRPVDAAKAITYFERAIENGSDDALVSMAVMYATGAGTARDPAKALSFYRRAKEAGHAHAFRGLSVMALQGDGMPADAITAAELYRQGLELGNAPEPELQGAIDAALDAPARSEVERRMATWRASRAKKSD